MRCRLACIAEAELDSVRLCDHRAHVLGKFDIPFPGLGQAFEPDRPAVDGRIGRNACLTFAQVLLAAVPNQLEPPPGRSG